MPSLIFINAVVSILFNQSIKLDEKDLANNAELLMTNVVPHVWDNTMNPPPGILSDATANLLNTSDFTLYDLSDSMFQNEDPTIYPRLLNAGCSKFYNDGLTCEGTDFYEPSEVRGGIVGIMTKCLMIRGDKCKQCQCIANNALFIMLCRKRLHQRLLIRYPQCGQLILSLSRKATLILENGLISMLMQLLELGLICIHLWLGSWLEFLCPWSWSFW